MRRTITLAALAGVLALAGCSGSDATDAAPSTTSSPVEPPIPATSTGQEDDYPFDGSAYLIQDAYIQMKSCTPGPTEGCGDAYSQVFGAATVVRAVNMSAPAEDPEVRDAVARISDAYLDYMDAGCDAGYEPQYDVTDADELTAGNDCSDYAGAIRLGFLSLTTRLDIECMEAGRGVEECNLLGGL